LYQGTNRFGVFFAVNVSIKVLSILLVFYIVLMKTVTTRGLILVFVIPLLLTVAIYELVWRMSTKGLIDRFQIAPVKDQVISLWKRGFVLYLANVCISLLGTIGNLSVSLFFNSIEFANYSFAFGLASVLYFAIDGLTAVATPYLARTVKTVSTRDKSRHVYLAAVWVIPMAFWLSGMLVKEWYKHYLESIPLVFYFIGCMPINIMFRSRVVSFAIAKGLEGYLFRLALGGLMFTFVSVTAAYLLFHSIYGVALGWSCAMSVTGLVGMMTIGGQSRDGGYSEYYLAGNAVAATLLFILCGAGGLKYQFAILYAVVASIVLGLNWRSRSLA
jgi:O-antigen/teichoic acid export membrane protein